MLPSIFGESLFDDWMDFPFRTFTSDVDHKLYGKHAARVMKTDLKEHDEGYELSIDLPGFKKDQIDLQLQNGYLTITASKGVEEEEKNKKGIDVSASFISSRGVIAMNTENLGIFINNTTIISDNAKKIYVALTGDQCAITDIRIIKG